MATAEAGIRSRQAPRPSRVLIAAGGTGGHIYPGLALAEAIVALEPEARVIFVGTTRGLEGTLVPKAGYELRFLDMVPLAGANALKLPYALIRSARQAKRLINEVGADVAVGMGGYASAPLIMGARMAGIASLLHESGAIPGRANLFSARFTSNIAVAFPEAARRFKGRQAQWVGMPLARDIANIDKEAIRPAGRSEFSVPDGAFMLFVTGGSQGAVSLNEAALGLGKRWLGRRDVKIVVKTGTNHAERFTESVLAEGLSDIVECVSFIDKIEHAYAAADGALCRAGAGTVAELAVVGLPSVLVPYPHAPGDHQALNARGLVDSGGAFMVRDNEATADVLGPLFEQMMDPATRDKMASALAMVAKPDAARDLARWTLNLAAR